MLTCITFLILVLIYGKSSKQRAARNAVLQVLNMLTIYIILIIEKVFFLQYAYHVAYIINKMPDWDNMKYNQKTEEWEGERRVQVSDMTSTQMIIGLSVYIVGGMSIWGLFFLTYNYGRDGRPNSTVPWCFQRVYFNVLNGIFKAFLAVISIFDPLGVRIYICIYIYI